MGWWYFYSLPTTLFATTHSHLLLDRNGKLLSAHIAADGQWRFPELESVPDKFATALIQFEDKRFQQHSGVDFLALARATYDNLRQQRVVSGASTLSMQVIRLSRSNPPRTLSEKGVELLRAWRLESRYSKDDILKRLRQPCTVRWQCGRFGSRCVACTLRVALNNCRGQKARCWRCCPITPR